MKASQQLTESWKLLNDCNWKMTKQSQKGDTIDMIKSEGKVKTCRLTVSNKRNDSHLVC